MVNLKITLPSGEFKDYNEPNYCTLLRKKGRGILLEKWFVLKGLCIKRQKVNVIISKHTLFFNI